MPSALPFSRKGQEVTYLGMDMSSVKWTNRCTSCRLWGMEGLFLHNHNAYPSFFPTPLRPISGLVAMAQGSSFTVPPG